MQKKITVPESVHHIIELLFVCTIEFHEKKLINNNFYIPGPDRDFSMKRFLAKQSHHLEGLPSSVENTFSVRRKPISCLAWVKYCLKKSA